MNQFVKIVLNVLCMLLFLNLPILSAFADGMPIINGRFNGGTVTVLALTEDQIRHLETANRLTLSQPQKKILKQEAKIAPSKLLIYDTRKGDNDCTCHAYNNGLMFAADQIEVPHTYLVTDAEAQRRDKELGIGE